MNKNNNLPPQCEPPLVYFDQDFIDFPLKGLYKSPMTDRDPRLEKIKSELNARKTVQETAVKKHVHKQQDNESMNVGLRAGAELITSIAAGGLIGYGLDKWLETKPIFLIAMLILGVITGFVNVWRTTQNVGYQVGYKDIDINNTDKEN